MPVRGLNFVRRLLGLPCPVYIEERKRAAARYVGRCPTVIDAGAHDGNDALVMSLLWPNGTIHAFEPVPATHAQLLRATEARANIKCYPMALAANSGEASMFISSGNNADSSSLLAPGEHLRLHPEIRFDQTVTVRTITLDDWADAQGLSTVDFLWLDMQGSELGAMRAGPRVMKTVAAVLTEVSYAQLYDGAPLADDVVSWMKAQGFRVARNWRDGEASGDILFVR